MLQAKNLTKEFNSSEALKDVGFTVDQGGVFCLPGANGSIKTLINIFLNSISLTSGEALIDGINVCADGLDVRTPNWYAQKGTFSGVSPHQRVM